MSDSRGRRPAAINENCADLYRRALRHRRRGEDRRALVLLREAAHSSQGEPRYWVHLGIQSIRMGRVEPGIEALAQAAWLLERSGARRKADVVRLLVAVAARSAA